MKTLSLLIVAFALSFSVSAQTTKKDSTHAKTHSEYHHANHEMYVLKDGKLMEWKNGKESAVMQEVTLPNGTTITTDGKVTWKDGKSQTLTNGQMVEMNGKIRDKKGMMKK
jgi:uncharacterized protein with beta-barrel porin domain